MYPFDYASIEWANARGRVTLPVELELERSFSTAPRRISEAFKGTSIVTWYGKIERQLDGFVNENEQARNHNNADKLRSFLRLWRENKIDGSLNIEPVENLLAGTEVSAVDPWKYNNYFSHLRDQLRKLKASVEELPVGSEVPPEQRAPSSSPPSSFGPTETPPAGAAVAAEPGAPAEELLSTDSTQNADAAAAALTGEAPPETEEEPLP